MRVPARSLVCVRIDVAKGLVKQRRRFPQGRGAGSERANKQNLHRFTAVRRLLCGARPWLRLNKRVYRLVSAVTTSQTVGLIQGEDKLCSFSSCLPDVPKDHIDDGGRFFFSLFFDLFVLQSWSESKVSNPAMLHTALP